MREDRGGVAITASIHSMTMMPTTVQWRPRDRLPRRGGGVAATAQKQGSDAWDACSNPNADGGWQEVEKALLNLTPGSKRKYEAWNKADAPAASPFFPPIDEKEVA